MKINKIILCLLLFTNQCSSQKYSDKPIAYKGFDFTSLIGDLRASGDNDSTSIFIFYLYYQPEFANQFGEGKGFMIHKKGIKYWFDFAQKRYKEFVFGKNFGYENASHHLLKEDKTYLNDFDKWIFFIDKKYLIKSISDGTIENYDSTNAIEENISFEPDEERGYEVYLLEQKAGEKLWRIVDKKNTSKDGIDFIEKWKESFINQQVKKYAQKGR